jgi:hypothetical protein
MEPEGGGVLRNLPRSRPGTRSQKRVAGAAKRAAPPTPPPNEREAEPTNGPVQALAGAAGTGVRVAGALSRELLRRLPRP